MKVLYIATECKPFSKTGGIGDVAGELPPALKQEGVAVEIVTPWYGTTRVPGWDVDCHGGREQAGVVPTELRGVPVNFIKNSKYFEGNYGTPYVNSYVPFFDDTLRFCFFSKACIHLIKEKEPDIVHINDWGLSYLFAYMDMEGLTQKRVITVHNVGYQGNVPQSTIYNTDMQLVFDRFVGLFEDPRPQWHSVNALRLGLELCHVAHTVSPTYAREMTLREDPSRFFEGGKGLEAVAARLAEEGRLKGILNGFEYTFEPTDDRFEKILADKEEKKNLLAGDFRDGDGFLLGFVGRAVEQKFKLLTEIIDGKSVLEHILDLPGVNVAVVATGQPEYEDFLRSFIGRHNYSATIAFDGEKARAISQGSDVFLMPSLFEPCGITQLESMNFATPPLVRWTGGLVDTVTPHDRPGGTGFGFDGDTRDGVLWNFLDIVKEAFDLYTHRKDAFKALQKNAFQKRFLWKETAREYIETLYEPLL